MDAASAMCGMARSFLVLDAMGAYCSDQRGDCGNCMLYEMDACSGPDEVTGEPLLSRFSCETRRVENFLRSRGYPVD